jgi:hypothetical protein
VGSCESRGGTGTIFLRVSLVPLANYHSSIAPYSSCTAHNVCSSPDQAGHYQVPGLKKGASSLTLCFTGYRLGSELCL